MIRYTMLSLALLSFAGAVWRALVAVRHYQASLTIYNDPSMRELEQVNTFVESVLSLVLLIHAVAFVVLARRGLLVRWEYAASVALVCAIAVSGSLLGWSLLSAFGVYPLTIVLGIIFLSHFLTVNWLSLYLGAGIGGTLGYLVGAPLIDGFVWMSVVGPCILLAFAGAGMRLLYQQFTARLNSS